MQRADLDVLSSPVTGKSGQKRMAWANDGGQVNLHVPVTEE